MLQNMNTNDTDMVVCANCGRKGRDINNTCNKCNQVKYCNAACKKKHRHKHKKECERLAVDLHDEKLFKQHLPKEDCPICFLLLPTLPTGRTYYSCCGKVICSGCIHAPLYDDLGNKVDNTKCPFCRTPQHKSVEEGKERRGKRVEVNDPIAMFNIGSYYARGLHGYTQDYTKALELFHRAGELGYAEAYTNIGYAYDNGNGVEVDKKKAYHYYELAAMGGCVAARHNLGSMAKNAGNMNRALKHYMIALGVDRMNLWAQFKKCT